ncbi:MAG: nucleotidyltransferase family protein [Pseudomonadota bacterium]
MPDKAMILAAGLGMRMRPITEITPKPLIPVGGKPMIDYALDSLARENVGKVVVNVHHLADQLIDHLAARKGGEVAISDEREELLDSGGAIVKALPLLGGGDFYVLNADTFWLEQAGAAVSNLARLAAAWNPSEMDMLLLTTTPDRAVGYDAAGDFLYRTDGRLTRYDGISDRPVIYAGAALMSARIFDRAPKGPFSLNLCFDEAIASERLFGVGMDGLWLTVGTPEAIALAEAAMRAFEDSKQPDFLS